MALSLLAFMVLAQNRADTLGKSNAQILAMGRKGWYAFYTGKQGESTAAVAGVEGLYADALAQRTDRLLKGRKSPLRAHLRDFANDAQGVGVAISGGGTMWNITAASFYADAEEAFYRITRHTGRAPRRVVSDVERAIWPLDKGLTTITEPKERKEGRDAMMRLRRDLAAVVADARQLSRRDSDTALEFCRTIVHGVADQAGTP